MASEAIYLYNNNILGFLIAAVSVVFLFRRLQASPILGYLVAGMLIGPHALKVITDPTATYVLGELGVLFLLFTLGLDLPLQRLQTLKRYAFGLGTGQVIFTGVAFTFFGLQAGLSKEAAILVGGALSLSSTAVALQVLNDRRELATRFGRVSFAVLLFQDLTVVLLFILSTTLGTKGSTIWGDLSYATLKSVVALVSIIGLGRLVFRPFYRAIASTGSSELFMATTFLVVLGAGFITEVSGLSRQLGSFLAGMLLAETEYRHQIEADIQPFRGLLLGVFFMSIGMGINIALLAKFYGYVLAILFIMLAIKALIIFILARVSGLKSSTSLNVALLLAGGGEFVFVIFSPAVTQKFLPSGLVDVLFLAIILSMALTPLLAFLGKRISDKYKVHETNSDVQVAAEELGGELSNHVIVAGFGRVGQMLGEFLTSRLIPFVGIDIDMRRVTEGRKKGWPVYYGDVRQLQVLKAVGAERARAIIITLNQMSPSVRTVMMVRKHFPDLPVCVRIKDHKHQEKLLNSGAYLVVPETVEPTIQLATSILHLTGTPPSEIEQLIDALRRQQRFSHPEEEKKAT